MIQPSYVRYISINIFEYWLVEAKDELDCGQYNKDIVSHSAIPMEVFEQC